MCCSFWCINMRFYLKIFICQKILHKYGEKKYKYFKGQLDLALSPLTLITPKKS